MKSKTNAGESMPTAAVGSGTRAWEIFDGDVRLSEDGGVQHLEDGKWRKGWGEWDRFPQSDLRPRDRRVVREWTEAVEAYRSGALV